MRRLLHAATALGLILTAGVSLAAPRMDSGSYVLKPSADQSGGGEASLSASDYRLGGTVGEVASSMSSASSYRLSSGSRRLLHYPNTVTGLTALFGISETSVTLQWSAPAQDGAYGRLQPGASYFIVISSNASPDHFTFTNAKLLSSSIFVSTRGVGGLGVPPGTADSSSTKGLVGNTTWFAQLWTSDADGNLSFASPRSTFTSLARKAILSGSPIFDVGDTSITVSWHLLPYSPPEASSMSAEGFIIQASSTNFGVYKPGGVIISSMTRDVHVSTLALGAGTALEYCTTYYFRLGTLNWVDATNYVSIDPYSTYDDDAVSATVHLIDVGNMNMGASLVLTQSIDIENRGRCPATYHLTATTVTAGSPWFIAGTPGFDLYSIFAGFNGSQPAAGAFGAEDALSDDFSAASASAFAIGQNGYQVPRGETRKLWLKVQTPNITSTEEVQDIQVTVKVVRDPPEPP